MFPTPSKFVLVAAAGMLLSGCPSIPDSYAPPQQRNPIRPDKPKPPRSVLAMNDPDAHMQFVRDIYLDVHAGAWRWTAKNPVVTVDAPGERTGIKLVVDLATSNETLKDTGPVTVRFLLNGRELGTQQYSQEGRFQFSAPVPPELVRREAANEISMEIDKTFTSPKHPAPHGFILVRVGLVP